jgi:hypothetical protein
LNKTIYHLTGRFFLASIDATAISFTGNWQLATGNWQLATVLEAA